MTQESSELENVKRYAEWCTLALNVIDLLVLMLIIVRAEEIGPLITGFALISLAGSRFYNHIGTVIAYIAVEVYSPNPKSSVKLLFIVSLFFALVITQRYFTLRYTELQLLTNINKLTGEAKQMADHIRKGFDYYQILKISPNASADDVTKALDKRMLELHPDGDKKCETSKDNTDRYDVLLDARKYLTDPTKRRQYDMIRKQYFSVVPPLKPISENCTW